MSKKVIQTTIEPKHYFDPIVIGQELTCPICHKTFNVDQNTAFYTTGGWTCSLECFNHGVKENIKRKKLEKMAQEGAKNS